MRRFSAYNRLGVFMGTSWPASCTRWHGLRGNSLPMIPLFPSQGAFCATAIRVTKEVRLCHSVDSCRATAFILKDLVGGLSQPDFVTEQSVKVLELMFGFLCGFLTKFLLHFIDIHRYVSPANTADYLCIRSFRKLRAFAFGCSLTPLTHHVRGFPA